MSSDSSDDNITLKEYQSRLQKASSSQFTSPGFDISISEYDDSDRDNTWKPTKEDLLSSSDDMDSDLKRNKSTPKKRNKRNSYRAQKLVDNENNILIASILEDILESVYNSKERDSYDTAVDVEI